MSVLNECLSAPGVNETLFSLFLISFGIPIFMILSIYLLIINPIVFFRVQS